MERLSLLVIAGACLALSVAVARMAALNGAPMLWFLVLSMLPAGMFLTVLAVSLAADEQSVSSSTLFFYAGGAGLLFALPNAVAFSAVEFVGSGLLSLVFAFPILFTYVIAFAFGMEKWCAWRAGGVVVALCGGLIIAFASVNEIQLEGHILLGALVLTIPVFLAAGNVFRSLYWPAGASPVLLAGLTLLSASACISFIALLLGTPASLGWLSSEVSALLPINSFILLVQNVAFFRLQRVAGPVYLSQLGNVAACLGIPVGVFFLGEQISNFILFAIPIVALGVALFQIGQFHASPSNQVAD